MKITKLRHARGLAMAAKMDSHLGKIVTQPDQYGDSAPATPTGGRDPITAANWVVASD